MGDGLRIDHDREIEFPQERKPGRYTVSCKGMSRSVVGPAGPDGKWECPVCGARVGSIRSGYFKMHRALRGTRKP